MIEVECDGEQGEKQYSELQKESGQVVAVLVTACISDLDLFHKNKSH